MRVSALAAVGVAVAAVASSAEAKVQSAWVQEGPEGRSVARLVVGAGERCPAIRLHGRRLLTRRRAMPTKDQPTVVCERRLGRSKGIVKVGGRSYDLEAASTPDRIVVVGDTGCTVEDGTVQNCNDPRQWPFAAIAASAARSRPDLVLHVGDLLYREDPCPPGSPGCAGDPSGDTYATLRADFFSPARPLLGAAPWVMVRGNHETCALDGPAWYRYFGVDGVRCRNYPPPYRLPLGGGLGLVVVDTAEASYDNTDPDQVPLYAREFRKADSLARRFPRAWMTTHQPPFGIDGSPTGSYYNAGNATLLPAVQRGGGLTRFETIVSGHQHLLQVLDFEGRRPSQLTIGNGGTLLDSVFTTDVTGTNVGGIPVARGLVKHSWGFSVLDRRPGGSWRMTAYGPRGGEVTRCELKGRRVRCSK